MNLDAKKQQFISSMLTEAKSKKKNDLMPFLLTITSRANKAGIQFTDEETDYIVKSLSAQMTPAERKKIATIRKIANQIGKQSKP